MPRRPSRSVRPSRPLDPRHLAPVLCLAAMLLAVLPGVGLRSRPPTSSPAAAATIATASAATVATAPDPGAPAVDIGSGEAPAATVAHWDPGDSTGPAAVDLYDATDRNGALGAAPVRSIQVAPGLSGVALDGLDPGSAYQAIVTLTGGAVGARRLGPSVAFRSGPSGPVVAGASPGGAGVAALPPAVRSGVGRVTAAHAAPCLGTGYGVGAVAVDGWSGVQGSYCIPPAFAGGTGAFCVDHGLDYPSGAYRWASSVVGGAAPLVNQHDLAANPADVARLAWIVATYGSTPDPARAVAVGVVAHAVMGDYPGLSTADLSPARLTVRGGAPGTIVADVAAMWDASGALAGPYQVAVAADPGPYVAGHAYRGTARVTGRSGGAEAGVAVRLGMLPGATATLDQPPTTGPNGTIGFTFTPGSGTVELSAVAGPLPPASLTLWAADRPPVAVQRVVSAGAPVQAAGTLRLVATVPGSATIVKTSTDPWVPVGAGFGFDLARVGPDGATVAVAHRDTAADGTLPGVPDLMPGTYRVTETARPAAFAPGGPWSFTLVPGEQARWQVADTPLTRPLRIAKGGDDVAAVPIGPGVGFAISADTAGDSRYTTPVATATTGADGTTAPIAVAPGRYRIAETTPPPGYQPAPPQDVTVPIVGTGGADGPITVTVEDHVVPGTLRLVKNDAASGAALPGATLAVGRLAQDGAVSSVGQWRSGAAPVDVSGLPPGRYVVREVQPPPGYVSGPAPETVTLLPGATLEVVFTDRATATSRPAAASSPLQGAPPAGATPATPAGAVATPTPAAVLAFTGLPVWRLLLLAAGATGLGATLLGAARRRQPAPPPVSGA